MLAAKYRVDCVLGTGGMGVLGATTHLRLDQVVALRPEALHNPEIVNRFEREARAAVQLKSEYVARIIDVGELDTGSPYIVIEYLEESTRLGVAFRSHGRARLAVSSYCQRRFGLNNVASRKVVCQ